METLIIVFILAVGIAAFGMYNLGRAWRLTRIVDHSWYLIERQEKIRTARNIGWVSAVLFVAAGSLFVWLLLHPPSPPAEEQPELLPGPTLSVTLTPTLGPATPTVDSPAVSSPLTATMELSNGVPLVAIPTLPFTVQATITNTDGGGLWLRDAPFGNGLILLPEESNVFIRGGLMEVDGVLWQNVADADGREGWVAADFLIYR